MADKLRIHKSLAAVAEATATNGLNWVVGGSAGLMLRGLPLAAEPRDIDIYCDDEDVHSIYESLKPMALDVPVVSETDLYRSTLCHFQIGHYQVELVGGFRVTAMDCCYQTDVKQLLIPYGDDIMLERHVVHVVPLAHELWFNALRGRDDRVELIAQAYAAAPGVHEAALQAIEANNRFAEYAKDRIHRLITVREAR